MTTNKTHKEHAALLARVAQLEADRQQAEEAATHWLATASGHREHAEKIIRQRDALLAAAESALNIEGPATAGARLGAWQGLDAKWHFDKLRAAITQAREETP